MVEEVVEMIPHLTTADDSPKKMLRASPPAVGALCLRYIFFVFVPYCSSVEITCRKTTATNLNLIYGTTNDGIHKVLSSLHVCELTGCHFS